MNRMAEPLMLGIQFRFRWPNGRQSSCCLSPVANDSEGGLHNSAVPFFLDAAATKSARVVSIIGLPRPLSDDREQKTRALSQREPTCQKALSARSARNAASR